MAFYLKERKIASKLAENMTVTEVDPIPDRPPMPAETPENEEENAPLESAAAPVPGGFKETESGLVLPDSSEETSEKETKDE